MPKSPEQMSGPLEQPKEKPVENKKEKEHKVIILKEVKEIEADKEEQRAKVVERQEPKERMDYYRELSGLLNETVTKAKQLYDNLAAQKISRNVWWKDSSISLRDKVLMRMFEDNPGWLKNWKGFMNARNNIKTPLLVVPGKSKTGKTYNLVFESNYMGISGMLYAVDEGRWDSRDVIKSLELAGLGGSTLIIHVGKGENRGETFDDMLITKQVDLVIINTSRALYDDSWIKHIEKFTMERGIPEPVIINPAKIEPEFHEEDWFKGYRHLFPESYKK